MSESGDRGRQRSAARRRSKRSARRPVRRRPVAARPTTDALTHHRRLALSASAAAVGLAFVGIGESLVGSVVTLGGLVALMFSIHRYGRLGVERAPRG